MKKSIVYIMLILLVSILGYIGARAITQLQGVVNGENAPAIIATTIHGEKIDLENFKGKYVILDFWGSWCSPCIRELPELVGLYKKYGSKVVVISIALEKSGDRWKTIASKYHLDWPYQIVEYNKLVMMSSLARAYGVTDIPAKFLVLPNGKLLTQMSYHEIDSILTKAKL